jgi:hypothetical protein
VGIGFERGFPLKNAPSHIDAVWPQWDLELAASEFDDETSHQLLVTLEKFPCDFMSPLTG